MLLPLLLLLLFPYKTMAQVTYQPGDVNQDGVIDINDATVLQMYLAEYDVEYVNTTFYYYPQQ